MRKFIGILILPFVAILFLGYFFFLVFIEEKFETSEVDYNKEVNFAEQFYEEDL